MLNRGVSRKKSFGKSLPRSFRRTKAFVWGNLLLWGVIGGWYVLQPPARQAEVARLARNYFDAHKEIAAFDVAWDLWQIYYSTDYVNLTATGGDLPIYGGQPRQSRSTPGGNIRVLMNAGYVCGYSDEVGNPLWVGYHLKDRELGTPPPRPEEFMVDTRTVARIAPEDYARSGYDRGHMAPNYAIAIHYGRKAQEETFLMSNITPQKHALNAGPWKQLEQRIAANYPGRFGEVWVLAGPVFGEKSAQLKHRVAVPEAFFMIVVDENEDRVRTEAFLFSQDTPAEEPLEHFLVTIDEIERRTGLDFLSELPDEAENALEARPAGRVW